MKKKKRKHGSTKFPTVAPAVQLQTRTKQLSKYEALAAGIQLSTKYTLLHLYFNYTSLNQFPYLNTSILFNNIRLKSANFDTKKIQVIFIFLRIAQKWVQVETLYFYENSFSHNPSAGIPNSHKKSEVGLRAHSYPRLIPWIFIASRMYKLVQFSPKLLFYLVSSPPSI